MQYLKSPPFIQNPNVLRLDGRARKFSRASQPILVTLTSTLKTLIPTVPSQFVYVIDKVTARFSLRQKMNLKVEQLRPILLECKQELPAR